jgi:Fe-S-cluster formation regulator IscX/YfhJ
MTKPVTWTQECADFWDRYTYLNEIAQEKYHEAAQMWLKKLRDAPPQREWVGLTDLERYMCDSREFEDDRRKYAEAIEAKLKEKNLMSEKNIQTSDNND